MFRQRNNKDCAVTVLAHVLGVPYTEVINSVPHFRFTRNRKRTHRERNQQIYGRRKAIRPRVERTDHKVSSKDPDYGLQRYNQLYRVSHFPYFCGFGLRSEDSELLLLQYDRIFCKEYFVNDINILRKIPFALLSVPSLNFPSSGHVIIWRHGRIWDPSPKKRYTWGELRKVKKLGIMAIASDQEEYKKVRAILTGKKLDGAALLTDLLTLAFERVGGSFEWKILTGVTIEAVETITPTVHTALSHPAALA